MKSLVANALAAAVLIALASSNGFAQTSAPTPHTTATQAAAGQAAQLQELTKKIEEQNAKIDMLSQQILKLQSHRRARRNAYLNCADAQYQRERAAKVQSHR